MKISLEGWRRRTGWWNISDRDISKLEISSDSPSVYDYSKTYLYRDDSGNVVVEHRTQNLRLNGHYLARTTLTANDIASLARIAFRGKPFDEIVNLLSESRQKKKSEDKRSRR